MIPWIAFTVVVLGMMAIDLFVLHRKPHAVKMGEALRGAAMWVGLAFLFAAGIWFYRGSGPALEFTTAYLIEESLSLDNLFVFLLIFSHFKVPPAYQHKVLFWGILGALVMRLAFIFLGVALLERFHWIIYVFGAVLVWSGIQMAQRRETEIHPERNWVIRLFRRVMPVTKRYHRDRFFVTRMGRRFATPLFIVLIMVETTDLIFAVDSIPAVLAISKDPFIVYTSNVFAILGLRTLFFALARLLELFHYLHIGLSVILVFVGAKMLLEGWIHLPIWVTLLVVAGVITTATIASIVRPKPSFPPED